MSSSTESRPRPLRRPLSPSQAALRTRPFLIGEWLIEPVHGRLRHPDGRNPELDSDTMMVLVLLTNNAGQLTSREEILATVFPEADDDEPLLAAIARLREHLSPDDAEPPGLIEEVAEEGYRLTSRVKLLANDSGHWRVDRDTGELVATESDQGLPSWFWPAAAGVLAILLVLIFLFLRV